MTEPSPVKLPDWKNAADYSHMQESIIGREGLAWECLRRNPDYQEDWATLYLGVFIDENGLSAVSCGAKIIPKPNYLGFYTPRLLPGETPNEWMARCIHEGLKPGFLSPNRYVGRKWGLASIAIDPNLNAKHLKKLLAKTSTKSGSNKKTQVTGVFTSEIGTYSQRVLSAVRESIERLETREVGGEELLEPENIVVVLDATLPWAKNEKSLKTMVANATQGLPRSIKSPNLDKLGDVLRVWDSQVQSPSIPKNARISKILDDAGTPSNEFIKRHRRATRLIVDGHYRRWLK